MRFTILDNFKENLFDKKTIKRLTKNISLENHQITAAKEWLELLENDQLKGETNQYLIFADKILDKILGYHIDKIIHHENNVEYQYADSSGRKVLCIEAKGTKTKSIFTYQDRSNKAHRTPIHQTWDYMRTGDLEWGICTNYKQFGLLKRNESTRKGYLFNFEEIKSHPEKLNEFVGIFSRENLVDGDRTDKIYLESATEEKEFTKEFYKLYHETRLMLIIAFRENENVSLNDAIYFTQIFLDRLIFIFFASDKKYVTDKRLFSNRILKLLDLNLCTQHSRKIYDEISELFIAFDKGDDNLGVFGFNGGLFNPPFPPKIFFADFDDLDKFTDAILNSKLSKSTDLNEHDSKILAKYQNQLSPIIKNLLRLDSFDFSDEVNVNILGHIFEQSISDIESLNKNFSSGRKKDGVYYTPSEITEYICKNTIIPYLSKTNVTTVEELIEEYSDSIEELEEKFKKIKILDPACGSGAFLIKAVDTLLDVGEAIQLEKELSGKYSSGGNVTFDKFNEEESVRDIIENNIFGVDINRESVGITKLSLFLKLAAYHRKLIGLSQNIQKGNSLVNDPSVDSSAFLWKERFPNIFLHENIKKHLDQDHIDGFDIIIGNPPWQILKADVDEFFSPLYEDHDPTQKFSKLTKIKKNAFMKKCLSDEQISTKWKTYLDEYKKQMIHFIESDNYEHQISEIDGKKYSRVDINLYKLFVEKSFQLLKPNGIFGMVLPSGIYSDLGTKSLRQLILNQSKILGLCGFINKKGIFPDIHKQFKFCTLLFRKGAPSQKFSAKFRILDLDELKNFQETAFHFDLDLVKMSSPDSMTIIECKNQEDQQILKKLFKFTIIKNHNWNFKASREFHMTDDSNLFHTGNVGLPLYEGKMIEMFDDNFMAPRYWIEQKEGFEDLQKRELNRIKKFTKQNNVIPQIHPSEYRLVWRTITNSIDKRTLIATILPPNVFLGHSLNYLNPTIFNQNGYEHPISYDETIFLCGLFNSFVIDFILRHKIATNLTIFQILELPIPRFDKENKLHQKILKNSSMLICTSEKYSELRKKTNIQDYVTEPSKRLAVEAQMNACVAKIYELTKEELEFILQIFTIEDKNLKDLTLDEFDLLK